MATRLLLLLAVLALLGKAPAHVPGQEFQYLSMFMHPPSPHRPFSREQITQLSRSYAHDSVANAFFRLPRRAILAAGEEEEQGGEEDVEERVSVGAGSVRVVREGDQEGGGDNLGERYGEQTPRLKMMVAKLIRQYAVDSIVDVPCRAHMHWMPHVVKEIAMVRNKQGKLFKYFCVDSNRDVLNHIKTRVPIHDGLKARFLVKRFWRDALPNADMVLSWSGLDNMKVRNVQRYVDKLANGNWKMILLGSHSGQLTDQHLITRFCLGGNPINFRRGAFRLKKPMRIVGNLSSGGNDKQLYVYKPRDMFKRDEVDDDE